MMFFCYLSIFRQMTMYLESAGKLWKSLTLTKHKTKKKNLGMKLTFRRSNVKLVLRTIDRANLRFWILDFGLKMGSSPTPCRCSQSKIANLKSKIV